MVLLFELRKKCQEREREKTSSGPRSRAHEESRQERSSRGFRLISEQMGLYDGIGSKGPYNIPMDKILLWHVSMSRAVCIAFRGI